MQKRNTENTVPIRWNIWPANTQTVYGAIHKCSSQMDHWLTLVVTSLWCLHCLSQEELCSINSSAEGRQLWPFEQEGLKILSLSMTWGLSKGMGSTLCPTSSRTLKNACEELLIAIWIRRLIKKFVRMPLIASLRRKMLLKGGTMSFIGFRTKSILTGRKLKTRLNLSRPPRKEMHK